jgi:hypothetical protein
VARARRAAEAEETAPRWAERLLAVAGGDAPEGAATRVDDFRRFLLLYGAVRSCLWLPLAGGAAPVLAPLALLYVVAAALAFVPATAGIAARVALPAVLAQGVWQLPHGANHFYLETVCVLCLALVRPGSGADARAALASLRWITAAVLFHTGLQKVLHGHYFRGDFLAFMTGVEARFARVFRWLLSDAEVARLASYDRRATGAGPYRVDAPLFVIASNLVWIAEVGLPVLLLSRRGRVLGALGGLGLMLGIQVAALEIGFALLFVNLLLLFLPGRWNARALPVAAAIFAWALGAAAGWLPGQPADWNLL